jgi:hypothetical protein
MAFTSHLAAKVDGDDTKFVKELKKYKYPEALSLLILHTFPLTKNAETSFEGMVLREDVNTDVKPSDTFVGETNSEKMKVTKTADADVLKYYGQHKAMLEVSFSTKSLGTPKQLERGEVTRNDMLASINFIVPNQYSVQASQTMLELVVQVSAQGLVTHLKTTEIYKTDPKRVEQEFQDYMAKLNESILLKADKLFKENIKFVEYDTKGTEVS